MPNAWVVRPYPDGVSRIKEFLEQDIVAIGWPHVPDLTSARDRQAIRSALRDADNSASERPLGQATGTVHRFRNEMRVGDYIVMPAGDQIFVGTVQSDYCYDQSKVAEGYPHQRAVDWLYEKRAVPRGLLIGRMHDTLKGRQTVFQIGVREVQELLEKPNLFVEETHAELQQQYLELFQHGRIHGLSSSSFEDAICALYRHAFPGLQRQATTASEHGDTDLKTELPGGLVVRIQVKHFYKDLQELPPWVVHQLAASMEPGEYGIIITSGTVSDAARREAESFSDRTIRFIDGVEVVNYLFEMLDELPDDTLRLFGIVRRPGIL